MNQSPTPKPVIKLAYGTVQESKMHQDEIVDQRRWVTTHEVIFEHEGKTYRAEYDTGSTEMQEGSGTEDSELLECVEVHQVTRPMTVWEAVTP